MIVFTCVHQINSDYSLSLLLFPTCRLHKLKNQEFGKCHVSSLIVHICMHYKEDENYIMCPSWVVNNMWSSNRIIEGNVQGGSDFHILAAYLSGNLNIRDTIGNMIQ